MCADAAEPGTVPFESMVSAAAATAAHVGKPTSGGERCT
jgi:hypothetical protein